MKKIFSLISLLAVCLTANAQQRNVDIQFRVIHPVEKQVVVMDEKIDMMFMIKNMGTDSLKYPDSLKFYLKINNNPIVFGTDSFLSISPNIAPGDSLLRELPMTFSLPTGSHDLCYKYIATSGSADTIIDPDLSNNENCVKVKMVPVGITELNNGDGSNVNVYPNPASGEANFNIHLTETGDVNIKVLDMTGRVILQENRAELSKGEHTITINTSHLNAGMYMYQVTANGEPLTGKLYIRQ